MRWPFTPLAFLRRLASAAAERAQSVPPKLRVPAPPPGIDLRKIRETDVSSPLGAVSYVEFISPLVGAIRGDFDAPIVAVVDRILLLALQQGAEEVRFDVRKDHCLAVRLRTREEWTALPPLDCTGSALSRLLVLGHLEKGEARLRPQTGRMTLYGVEMQIDTEPMGPWRENIRVRIGRG